MQNGLLTRQVCHGDEVFLVSEKEQRYIRVCDPGQDAAHLPVTHSLIHSFIQLYP